MEDVLEAIALFLYDIVEIIINIVKWAIKGIYYGIRKGYQWLRGDKKESEE